MINRQGRRKLERDLKRLEKRKLNRESGAFLLLAAVVTMLLVGGVSLALDSSNLMFTRLRLYEAIDNAIVNAPVMYVGQPYVASEIHDRLDAIARANLEADDKVGDIHRLKILVENADVQIKASINGKSWLNVAAFGGGSDFTKLEAFTRVEIPRVNFALVLDASYSMSLADETSGAAQSKLSTALGATRLLGSWLRESYDRVGIIIFHDVAQRVIDFRLEGGYSKAEVEAVIPAIYAGSWTNMSDGLYASREIMDGIAWPANDFNVVAVMSDNWITHGRANFANPKDLEENSTWTGPYDYHFQLERLKCRFNCGSVNTYVSSQEVYSLRRAPISGAPPWFFHNPKCQKLIATSNMYGQQRYDSVNVDCLRGLGIHGGFGVIRSGLPVTADNYRELAYYSAIAQSDKIRNSGAHVFGLGIGGNNFAPTNYTGRDRLFAGLGGIGDSPEFTNVFMRRLALSAKGQADPAFPGLESIPTLLSAGPGKFAGEFMEANSDLGADEALRMVYGRMKFRKLF